MPLAITSAAHAAIRDAAARAAPNEACGILLGQDTFIYTALQTSNVHPDPACHFEIDPAALIAAHKAARAGGRQVLGYYHSHPNGLARPSATDRASASGDGRIWAIAAGGEISLWRDGPSGFEPLSYALDDGYGWHSMMTRAPLNFSSSSTIKSRNGTPSFTLWTVSTMSTSPQKGTPAKP